MNPAFESTAVLDEHPARALRLPTWAPRFLHATSALLAVVALGLVAAAMLLAYRQQALSSGALVCALVALGLLRGARSAQLHIAAGRDLVDEATQLYNPRGFAECGGEILRIARAAKRPVSLVVLDFNDMVEVRHIYGREISCKLLARVVRKLETLAGSQGIAARMDRAQFAVVLPGVDRERAQAAVHRVLGRPCRVEFDAGDSEIVLVPDVMAETAAPDVETIEELHAEVLHGLMEMRSREMRRQHYLQRERERHSRPMGLSPSFSGHAPDAFARPAAAPVEPTLPVALQEEL
ncbi:diguanylate cyclase [Ramlibacter sp.]|uniref:GGDEF domain-containing protein n=1 Tax=Ramlibacter sp. TaxID=1917967 RepID=UPI0017B4930B|nr:diguanylate cyclase [Ramlibacter sp.]MBA2675637.1 diguanylate cyclase [Ramlibacter sp.]